MHTRFGTFLLPCLLLLPLASSHPVAASDDWIDLFDGTSLAGWKAAENPASFQVSDGELVCQGPRAHLFYVGPVQNAQFKNFEMEAEVLTRAGANSGIYFHTAYQESGWPTTGFEVQISNSHHGDGGYREHKKTGSLYGVRNVYKPLVQDNEWFTVRFSVQANRVRVHLAGTKVVDYQEPAIAPDRPEEPRLSQGTFALQAHDPDSHVRFRRLRVRPLPDTLPAERAELPIDQDHYAELLSLHRSNVPVIDLHAHLKGGLTIEEVLRRFYQTGINYGIAVNGGIGFPITNDAGIHAFRREMEGHPVFVGLQAEGREWIRLFSREAIARFDYVFTDALTFTDDRGNRTRLWIPSEVEVTEPDSFMDMYVSRIVEILEQEPIDIFVNPTFLPEILAADYDRLWTPGRMQTVIDAAVRMGIAIEINDRYQIPSVAFLRLARKSGAKFALGTNNGGRDDLGYLAYALRVQRELGLSWQDFYVPGWQPSRAALVQ
jgi:hypothetical protein